MGKEKRAWRKQMKKLRRKGIRQKLAISTNANDEESSKDEESMEISEIQHIEDDIDKEYFLSEEEWLERERHAELVAAMKKAVEEKLAKTRAEQEKKIQAEWEEKERREKQMKEETERLEKARKEKQARRIFCCGCTNWLFVDVQNILNDEEEFNQFLDFLCGDIETPPLPYVMPEGYNAGDEVCQYFSKTGACRYFDRCKLAHPSPNLSQTILIPNFFSHFLLEESLRDEYDTDLGLEYEDSELQKEFLEFYNDVLPEFQKHGKIIQFKVCCNLEAHLRGNVYIQYQNIRSSVEAFRTFNGRFYNGKQISLRFVKIDSWKTAICWSFLRKNCIKGRSCNFLHVFRNPTKEFVHADRDWKEWTDSHNKERSLESLVTVQATKSAELKTSEYTTNKPNILRSQENDEGKRSRSRSKIIQSKSKDKSSKLSIDTEHRKSRSKSKSKVRKSISNERRSKRSRRLKHSKSRSRSKSKIRRSRSKDRSKSKLKRSISTDRNKSKITRLEKRIDLIRSKSKSKRHTKSKTVEHRQQSDIPPCSSKGPEISSCETNYPIIESIKSTADGNPTDISDDIVVKSTILPTTSYVLVESQQAIDIQRQNKEKNYSKDQKKTKKVKKKSKHKKEKKNKSKKSKD